MRKRKGLLMISAGFFAFCMAACVSGRAETPTPVATPTVAATVTPVATPTEVVTVTPVPTEPLAVGPTSTPVPEPTREPVPTKTVEAPFVMVSPVPQSGVTDIVGTMTIDTYPVVDGSTATLPLSEAVFMAATGESAEVAAQQVVHTKTTNSYLRLYDKEVDLLIVYEPAESIVERMKEEPLCIKPIGLDALVFLANQANPVESLTMEQLVDIYSGKITNWSEAGGLKKELLAFQRPEGSGSQTLMQKLVMGDVEMMSGDNVFRYGTMSDILEGMLSYNNEDNTLGYSVFYYANNMYFEKDLKLMGVDGVVPSTRTIYDGSYKLTNAFYAVIRTDEPEDSNARKIFDWLTGEAGQQLVLDLGYVPMQMPEGADISDGKAKQREAVEILAKEPLEEGQHFVFFHPQNMASEYYYGDMTVYNHKWEEVVNFYNVTLNHNVQGIYNQRYLPIGQIRQNTEGEQVVRYGVFDLEQGEYSIVPSYPYMEVLDVERGYYAVPPEDGEWSNYRIINGKDEILLPKVAMEDWLTISPFGNGYWERSYDYENWDNGCTHRFYDENLKLTRVYCETAAALPPQEEWVEGVDYYLMEDPGCLIDENMDVILNWATFLERYGDGTDMNCKLQFYTPTLGEEKSSFPVWYQNKVYLVDRNLDLVRLVENQKMVDSFENAIFYADFCHYLDWELGEWVFRTYEGEELRTIDGKKIDDIVINWTNQMYVLYRQEENLLYIEEHSADGEVLTYTITLADGIMDYVLYYTTDGYLVLNQNCGELMKDPYDEEGTLSSQYMVSLLYQGNLIDVKHGMHGADIYALDEEHQIWTVRNGERIITPSESIFEDYDDIYALGCCTILEGPRVVYELDNAVLMSRGGETVFLLSGNYMYAVGFDGTVYAKALHNFMGMD